MEQWKIRIQRLKWTMSPDSVRLPRLSSIAPHCGLNRTLTSARVGVGVGKTVGLATATRAWSAVPTAQTVPIASTTFWIRRLFFYTVGLGTQLTGLIVVGIGWSDVWRKAVVHCYTWIMLRAIIKKKQQLVSI